MKIFYLLTFLFFTIFTSNASTYEEANTRSLTEVVPLTATVTASSTSVCQNSGNVIITFTGSGGIAPYTFVYTLNNGPTQSISSNTSSVITLDLPSTTVGTFTYQLVSVTSAGVTEVANDKVIVVVSPPIVANFTNNATGACSGTTIPFNSTVSGGTGNYSYNWEFGDGTTSNIANPSHVFTALGCGNQTFTVKVTITSGGCTTVVNHPIIVKQKPDINFVDADIFFPFSNCHNNPSASNSNYTLVLNNASPSQSCIVSYDINWGDNSTLIGATFPASHTYTQLGAFQLTVTAHGLNGCKSVKTYPVANQSNPAGGLGTLGSTTGLCAPAVVPFTISNWELNSPGTTYLLNFGDGTSITLDHPLVSSTIYHTYTTSSCPEPTFTATLKVINLCDTTPYSAGNIQIRIKPEASFTGPLISCVGQNVCFTSNSILGSSGNNCTPLTIYTWNFGDPSGGGNIITENGTTIPNGCHAYSVPGNYTVSLTLSNPCGSTTYTRQICIESPLSPQFTLSQNNGCSPLNVTTSNTTNLSNSCGTPTYLWNVNYAAGNCGSGTPAPFYAAGSTSASANPLFQFITPGTYSISLTTTNSCGSVTSAIQTVIIKKPPTVSIATISNYCGSATITPTATISTCAPTGEVMTYAWTFPGGSPATSSTANPGPITYSSAGNNTVSLIVTNSCGASASASQTFTVNVAPTITNTTLSQTICSGQQTSAVPLTVSPSNATFAWTATATSGVTGFTTSGSSAIIPSQTITNTGSTAGTVTYTITPTTGTCAGSVATYIVTVYPTPSISTHPANATVCQNAVMNPLNVAFIKGTGLPNYQWYSNTSNSNSGGVLIPSATGQTFIPPSTTVGTMYYYVVISFPTSGCANLISNTATISINPPISITTQPLLSQTICVGGSSSLLSVSYSGGSGTPTYQWYSNNTATNSGGTIISGQTSANYTPSSFSVPGTYHYYAVISMAGNGCGQAVSNISIINVVADPTVTLTPPSQIICAGVTPEAIIATASGGNGAYSYQWYLNTTPSNVGGSPIAGATNSTYTPLPNTPGIKYYYVIVKQITSSGCEIVSTTVSIQTILAAMISNQPASSTVCVDGSPTLLSVSYINGVGTPTYQWYSNTTNSTIGGIQISGATSTTYQPTASTSGTTYYYVVITLPSGGCSSLTSTIAAVNVVEPAVITTQPTADQTICVGGSIAPLTVAYSGATGTPSYQWYKNTTASNSGGVLITGANSATYTPPTFNTVGIFHFYATITISGNGCGAISSTIATVNVVADPTVTLSPLTQTLCAGAIAAPITAPASGGTGTFLYQWFTNSANNNTSGTSIIGETNSTYTPLTTTVGTQYYYVVVTQVASGCSVNSSTSSVIVNPSPTISSHPASSTVCVGGSPTLLSVSYINGVGTPTYQWYSNTTNSTVGGIQISGATSTTYQPTASTSGTTYYYVVITLPSGGCSSLTSTIAAVNVVEPAVITTQPTADQTICVGGSIAPLTVAYIGATGTPSYQWYKNTTGSYTGGVLITGANSPTYTPPTFNTVGIFHFYATITISGNGCGAISSNIATVNVVADPTVTLSPLTQTLCAGAIAAPITASASGGTGSFLYQWFTNSANSNTSGTLIIGETNSTYTPLTTTVGTQYYYVAVSSEISGCSNTSATSSVTVIASPTFTQQPVADTVCQGGTLSPLSVTYSNGTGIPTYQWFSNSVNNTATGTAISGATNPTYIPSAAEIGTQFYYVVITFPASAGCSSITSDTAEITITAGTSIVIQPIPSQSLCVGGSLPNTLEVGFTGGTGTPSYQWFINTTATNSGGTAITGATASIYSPPVYLVVGTYYYYAVVSLNGSGCGAVASAVAQVNVLLDPNVTTQPIISQTLCQSATPEALSVTASDGVGTFSYQWYSNATNSTVGGQLIAGADTASFIPNTDVVGTLFYYVVIMQSGAGCQVTSATSQLTINLAPSITQQPISETVCLGATLSTLSISYTNGTGIPTYQWYANAFDNTLTGVPISGANGPSFTPISSTVGTVYYYAVVTLPSSGGCSAIISQTAAITVKSLPTITLQPQTSQSICVDGNIPGPLSIDFEGGDGVPTYQWFSNTINSNTGGTIIPNAVDSDYTPPAFTTIGNYYYYAVVSLSGNGCGNVASETATVVVVNDPVVTLQPLAFQEICQNSVPSILTVNVSGGVGTIYNYQWYLNTANNSSGGNPIAGATAQNYSPETNLIGTFYYYVIISQAPGAGCSTISATSTVVLNAAPVIQNQPSSSVICLGQAVVLGVSYINGAGIPQYQWYSNTMNSTVGANPILGATLSNYTPSTATAGTMYYYAIISLPGGCGDLISDIVFVTVNANPVIASTSQVICSGNSFIVNPDNTGGNVVPVGTTFTWSTPTVTPPGSIIGATEQTAQQTQISQTLVNSTTTPATVTYTVTPIWETCLGEDFTITVTVNPSISANVTFANSTCYAASNGNIQTNITGGIPFPITPYQISWTGPGGFTSSAPSIFNLAPGTYNLTINDAGGCPFTASYSITEPDEIIIGTDSENNITCFGDADGAISISVIGGTLSYQYTWTKNNLPFSSTEDIANLGPGNYTISVTDAYGCGPALANFTIIEPPLLTVTLGNQTNILCYSAATGAISVNVAGGTPIEISAGTFSYTFLWSGPNGFTSTEKDLTNLLAGTYNLNVTDQNGCSKNLTVILTQNTEIVITASTTPITCYGANNASISLTVSGGVGPYQAAWDNLATGLFQDNLGPGTYIITITDALGCQKPITVVIADVPVFMVNPIVQQISCYGANNGSINLNLTGGIAPVTMIWTDGSTAGLIRNNLGPGSYTAIITDGTPCQITRTFVLVEPQPLVLTAAIVNAFVCDNANTGSINLTVGGGTAPYTYSWTDGASTEDLLNITSGTYSVTVTDARGCTKTAQFTITRPSPIVIIMNVETVADCSIGSVRQIFTAQVSGGVAPFTNTWSSGTISGTNNQTMTTSQNTTVVFSTTDSLGCTASYTFDVDVPIISDADFSTTSIGYETYGLYSIIDPIQFTNGAQGDWTSMSWDFGDGSFSTEENPTHSYVAEGSYVVTQTVTYPFGCVYKHIISLLVKKGYFLEVPSAFTPNGDSLNDTFRPISKGMHNVQLSVYDTWGSLIYFEQGTILRGWDGTIKGRPAENGNYYCKVSAETFYRTTVNVSQPFVLIN